MFFRGKKEPKKLSEDALEGVKDLDFEMEIRLKCDGGYKEPTVAKIEIKKRLMSTSDSKVEGITDEVEGLVKESAEEFIRLVCDSRHLSEGYHTKKNQTDEEGNK